MIFKHSRRTVPELNTTSTADISFILLVFFLVISSMDVDKGLSRRLPPVDSRQQTEAADVSKSNVLELKLTAGSVLEADGKPLSIDLLRRRVERFVSAAQTPAQRIITLEVDRSAGYDAYFNIQNEITAAYRELRDRYARRKYSRPYEACTPDERDAVRDFYPQHLTESMVGNTEGGAR